MSPGAHKLFRAPNSPPLPIWRPEGDCWNLSFASTCSLRSYVLQLRAHSRFVLHKFPKFANLRPGGASMKELVRACKLETYAAGDVVVEVRRPLSVGNRRRSI